MNLFTLLTALYLRKILIQLKMNPNFVILWSLNPNVLLEFNHNGHNDVIAIFLFVFGIYYLNKGDENKKFLFLSGLLFSLSIGIKIFPIFIIPFLVNKIKLGIIPLIISIFTQFYIFISSVNYEISGIRVFLEYWRFNGGLYEISDYVLNIIDNSFNNVNIETILRPIFSIIFIFIFISLIIFHYVGKNDKINDYYLISISYLVLFMFSPVLHPWYLLWALIPIILSENKFIFYWIFLFTINFSYLFYFCNCDNIVIILIEYLPIFLFLIGILLHKLNSILIIKKKAKFN